MTAGIEQTNPTSLSKEVPINELPSMLKGLFSTMLIRWKDIDEVKRLFTGNISASCLQCGMAIHGRELFQIATQDQQAIHQNPKLARLVQAYCGRKDCKSYYYLVSFAGTGSMDWEDLLKQTENSVAEAVADSVVVYKPSIIEALVDRYGTRNLTMGAGITVLVLFFAYWQFIRVPSWSSKPSPFQVDPASIQTTVQQ